jgi:hypothetical protein
MEAARDLVATATELAAGVQDRMHDLERVLAGAVLADRDAATIVDDLDRAVLVDRHLDVARLTRHRLVDRVGDDLPDEVVETANVRRTDVHAGALPDSLEPLEHLDALGRVVGPALGTLPARAGAVRSVHGGWYRRFRGRRRFHPRFRHSAPPTSRW